MNVTSLNHPDEISFDRPAIDDGMDIWRLIGDSKTLDQNSPYNYLLLCKHFPETCVVARQGKQLRGFMSAYIHPQKPETVFIWQVAVHQDCRKSGVARSMLQILLNREACRNVRFLETTVSPSNKPSRSLFYSLARDLQTTVREELFMSREDFGQTDHEDEVLLQVGPFHIQDFRR
ncbi:MAG: diaminobutyrate acetyltransferase [Methanosarcinales archaeon]|nr:diaminobutyrate acetyltransferase [Methanosarcinales archaeon]